MFEFLIARRYLKSKHSLNLITIISAFSTAGIAIGVAALIIVLSVFNGFGSLVKDILVNFDPHVKITFLAPNARKLQGKVESILKNENGIESYGSYVEGRIILLRKKNFEILTLRGVEEESGGDWKAGKRIFAGNAAFREAGLPGIVIGLPLALKLSARPGNVVKVISANAIQKSAVSFSMPQTQKFAVTGIFDVNEKTYSMRLAFTSLKAAQKALGLEGVIQGYEIKLKDFGKAEMFKQKLLAKLPAKYFKIQTWYDLHRNLYKVMKIERWAAYLLLTLIIAVSTFNLLTSLAMSVIEKERDIAIFRAMGATKKRTSKIFLYQGTIIGLIGTFAGVALGLLVCYIQIHYNIYPLDSTKYIINALPVKVRFGDVLLISFSAFALTFLASLYASRSAIKTNIIKAIKWE